MDGGWWDLLTAGGTWGYLGEPGPLGAGFSGFINYSGASQTGEWDVFLDGCVGYPDSRAVAFERVEAISSVCDGQPRGRMQVRAEDGRWYSLDFDDCSGCAMVSLDETPLGETCLDLGPAFAALYTVIEAGP